MHRVAKLLRRWRIRIVVAEVGVIGFVAVRAPVPLVLARIRVKHDHAMIAVAVGDVHFIRLFIDERLSRQAQVFHVVAALAAVRLPDLHQELAVLRKFQDLIVQVGRGGGCCGFIRCAAGQPSRRALPRPLPPIQTFPL